MNTALKSASANPQRKKSLTPRAFLFITGCFILLLLSMAVSIAKGAMNIPLSEVLDALLHFDPDNTRHLIIVDLRLPRVLASALVGSAFAVAGGLMQGVTRNPMADSGLMGLNAGAGFSLALCFAFFTGLSYMSIIFFSFLGAALGAGLVYGIASVQKGGATPMRLVLAGAATSALLSALSQGIAYYHQVDQDIMFWLAGGVAGSDWRQLKLFGPWVGVALVGAIAISRQVTLLSLGEEVSKGLGLNTTFVKGISALLVLMLAGASVAVMGAVGFIGLVIPHLVRYFLGLDYKHILPGAAVLGALLMVLADLGARMLNPPFETPVGALISLIGVPFFLYLARKERRAF